LQQIALYSLIGNAFENRKNIAGPRGKDKHASQRAAAMSLNDRGNDGEEDEEEMSESSVLVGKENVIAKENHNLKKKISNLE
jgi:hypothetical protein